MFSGGPDSTTLLYDLRAEGRHVHALTFSFGEAESLNERKAAVSIVDGLEGVTHHYFDFASVLREFYGLPWPQLMRKAAGPMNNHDVSESKDVQPFGSAIALMLSASWALKNGVHEVCYAVHKNDSIFADNHSGYFSMLSDLTAACEGSAHRVVFQVPYLDLPKSDVIERGNSLGVPFDLTWSCAVGGDSHCGTCDPCRDRRMAFLVAGVEDPAPWAPITEEQPAIV